MCKRGFICSLVFLFLSSSALLFAGEPQRYALVLGVTGYPSFAEDMRLKYADEDAKLFYNFITNQEAGRFSPENVKFLVNENATRTSINKAIAWLGKRVLPDDIVYIFFSGHGVVDDQGLGYFMPYDADPALPDDRGFRADQFVKMIHHKLSSTRILVFVDACHSGSVHNGGFAKEGLSNVMRTFKTAMKQALEGEESLSMAFLSASSNQKSYEDKVLKHGVFSWYLVTGLKGNADRNRDQTVTAGELHQYLVNEVERHAKKVLGKIQTPDRSPQFNPSFPMSVKKQDLEKIADRVRKAGEARKLFLLGLKQMREKKWDEAIATYRESIKRDPEFADAYINLGYIHQGRFNLESSIWNYKKAIEIDPASAAGHNNLGFNYILLGKYERAVSHLNRSYSLMPSALTGLNLGDAYRYIKDFDSALKWHAKIKNTIKGLGKGEEFYLGWRWRYNYFPLYPGDIDTINASIDVPDKAGKSAFIDYALSFDYALKNDFKKAEAFFESAWRQDSKGAYRHYFANRIRSIINFLSPKKTAKDWFKMKRKKLMLG